MKDKAVRLLLFLATLSILLIVAGILYSLATNSFLAIRHFGLWDFLSSSDWDSREGGEQYGALSPLLGSISVALLAVIITIPFSISVSMLCGGYYAKTEHIREFIHVVINYAAKIPSIIWGIWGYFIIRPLFTFFNVGEYGFCILTAAVVLSMMITPSVASLSIACVKKVPQALKEAAYSLGATKMEIIWTVNLPYTKNGIIYAHLLALSKVLGESIIVTMLIGNVNKIPTSITDTGNTIGSLLINEFNVSGDLKMSALFALVLMLFLLTATINTIANYILRRTSI